MPPVSSIQAVIDFIQSVSHDDWERARGAYDSVANNISYDFGALNAYLLGAPLMLKDYDLNTVFTTRTGVCAGYSSLYAKIAEGLGLKVQYIVGVFRASQFLPPWPRDVGHAWNAVMLDGTWHLLDVTAGSTMKNAGWFDMDPRLFAINHFTEDKDWTLVTDNVTQADFDKAPFLEPNKLVVLVSQGFTAARIIEIAKQPPFFLESSVGISFDGMPPFGGGVYYGDEMAGFALGLDAEYLSLTSGSEAPAASAGIVPVCLTVLASIGGLYGEYGIGAGFSYAPGSVMSFSSVVLKLGGGYNVYDRTKSFGLGIAFVDYLPLYVAQEALGLTSFPNDLLSAFKLSLIYRF